MSARSDILASIRKSLHRDGLDGATMAALDQRLVARHRHVQLSRTDLDAEGIVALFEDMALARLATLTHVTTSAEIPAALADFLSGLNLPAVVKAAPALTGLPWQDRPTLTVAFGAAVDSDAVSLTPCVAAVAETGTLVLTSGPDTPSTLNFLPDTHVVVVRRSQITGSYETALDRIRDSGAMPRTINMITGPSCTGDIEQVIQMGAHGPRRLHILLVDGE